jgi:hypothetical protein
MPTLSFRLIPPEIGTLYTSLRVESDCRYNTVRLSGLTDNPLMPLTMTFEDNGTGAPPGVGTPNTCVTASVVGSAV